ncbi:putative carbonyl reductase [Aspergillus saccharolyticus JOP 1030-1]|uniref:Putative carbonyl reductase n=1 Tax=Aspergillus saccharolyticus JOP 1030-1 TaxID=1450539 RepID=A0A318Z0R1_9EURO|nr:putative carbonyl reductase [Aspergillus saccharolyticus JOP 1030-1]PYH40871.1 putative carbonyl reductase [Aspergillus saccharolyticus JOP 1030-1]
MTVDKKIVLITGANKGVGYETAKALLLTSADYHVLLASRDPARGAEALESLQREPTIQGTAAAMQLDVTDDASIQAAAQQVKERYGRLDVLINNAGISNKSSNPGEQVRANMATNVVGPVVVTDAFEPLLKAATDPRIIFVTSSLGSLGHASNPNSIYYSTKASYPYDYYRASKAALNMIMVEYGKRNPEIKVFGGDPGWLATDLANKEQMQKLGAPHPEVGAREIVRIVLGERDEDVGKVVGKYGVQIW